MSRGSPMMTPDDEAKISALLARATVAHTLAFACFAALAKCLPDSVSLMSEFLDEAIQKVVRKQDGDLPTRTAMLLAESELQKMQDLLLAHKRNRNSEPFG